MTILRGLNLGLRFLLELGALVALGWWGWGAADATLVRVALAVAGPVLAAALWGAFVAPRARRRLPDPLRLVPELAVFGSGTAALWAGGATTLAWAYGAAVVVSIALMFAWGDRGK